MDSVPPELLSTTLTQVLLKTVCIFLVYKILIRLYRFAQFLIVSEMFIIKVVKMCIMINGTFPNFFFELIKLTYFCLF